MVSENGRHFIKNDICRDGPLLTPLYHTNGADHGPRVEVRSLPSLNFPLLVVFGTVAFSGHDQQKWVRKMGAIRSKNTFAGMSERCFLCTDKTEGPASSDAK
jgi:hypothetical protein